MVRFDVGWFYVFVSAVGLFLLAPLRDTGTAIPRVEYEHAMRLFQRGQLEKSQWEADRGYIQNRTSNPKWAAKFHLLEAEILLRRGMSDDAMRLLHEDRDSSDSPQDSIRELAIEAVTLSHQQKPYLADQTIRRADDLCKGTNSLPCGEVLQARGAIAMSQDQLSEARLDFLRALTIARSVHDRYLQATAALNLGWLALQVEHFEESVDWSTEAHRISVELGAEDLAQNISGNLGWAYFKLGDTERALELFVEAEQEAATLGNLHYQINWLITAGNVYQETGYPARAAQSYSQALALAQQIDSKEDIVDALEDLAHASIDTDNLQAAKNYLTQLHPFLAANNNRLDALDVRFAQGRIAAASHDYTEAESIFHDVERDPSSETSMRFGAEHELARLYESEDKPADADRMYRTSLSTFESARASLKSEESKLPFLANATGIYDDYIHFLVSHHRADEALAFADHSRARTLEQGLGVTSGSPRAVSYGTLHPGKIARKTDATLLFYWLGERESYLWAITPAKTAMFTLPARNKIAPAVERYRKALLGLSDPVENSNADGVALYRMLVAPARELIQPGSAVVILDDGVLSELNFETLIAPQPTPHYFIEDATLVCASSLDLLASAKPPERTGSKLLLVGDALSPNPDYPDLPKAATEMNQIEKHFSATEVTVFARERATAVSYLASAPQQFSYIHFVAHGVASRTDPLDSAIILSRSTADADSFKLQARDIMKHPIHARLVTISACYGSGTRSYAGEGLVGLAWAFLRAGAHHVIGALWEVSEESTPRLMGSLYQGLENGQTPADALRHAKLSLLHSKGEFRKPFFWAPLQIYTGV